MTTAELKQKDGVILVGHRGYAALYPENTMVSYEAAVKAGVDIIEVDVTLSRDKVVMISHDDRLDRVSNGHGLVADFTAQELQRLDCGTKAGLAFAGEPMPTFAQVIELMKRYPELMMDVDFKVCPAIWETVERTMPMLEEAGLLDRCIFNSCDGNVTRYLSRERGLLTVGCPHDYPGRANFDPGPDGTYAHLWAVCVPIEDLTPERAYFYREKGIVLACCSPDTPEQFRLTRACGVKMAICDDPVFYRDALSRERAEGHTVKE